MGNKPNLRALLKIYISNSEEKTQESIKVVQNDAFITFGITGAAIIEISKNSYLVMTDDNPFYGILVNKGIDTVNLDELRLEQQ